jgi:hypothetical protein
MEENFITYATDILGDTATGLKGSEIDRYFAEYSMKFDRKLSSEGRSFMSKRDKLKLNLQGFNDNEKYYIINDLFQAEVYIQTKGKGATCKTD